MIWSNIAGGAIKSYNYIGKKFNDFLHTRAETRKENYFAP